MKIVVKCKIYFRNKENSNRYFEPSAAAKIIVTARFVTMIKTKQSVTENMLEDCEKKKDDIHQLSSCLNNNIIILIIGYSF